MKPGQHDLLLAKGGTPKRTTARWFFDVVSPFSYLHLSQFDRLHSDLEIQLVPVLFAGLLRRWGTKGPAELPTKRIHTYRYCAWVASRYGIPFRMPPRHPFNPLPTQRLLVGLAASRPRVERTFDFIYGRGRDPEREWNALCGELGVADAESLISDSAVKQQLIANTEEAADAGVFGVPTFIVRGELFWGGDTIDWMNAFIDDPKMFEVGEMRRASELEFGARREPAP
jgi:2-hydroxychromene-2-carboxylate isomerase